ncbi:putative Mutator transposable element [Senna tora]|uniref:Putative Mutator transposable element n=1 Tax=Senna tora TaxID=362788 RepID=A0A834T135_9FABA|nr:putative Mutator transposable element [Senna tora]
MSKIKLEIHHGSRLQLSPIIAYIGGRKDIYENFDPDFITVTDIAAFIIKECGYSNYSTIWYKFEVDDFSDIFVFEKDKDVMKILNTFQNNDCKVLQLFVEHKVDEEPEVVATASSTAPLLLTLTPQSQIDDDIGEDSDAEQLDLFFEDGGKGKRVPQDNGGEQRDGVTEQSGEASSILVPQNNDAYVSGWDGEAHSEYDDSDELVSLDGSSDNEANKRPRFKSFNEVIDFKRPINLEVGLKFTNHQIYQQALKQYCIENGIVFKYKKNENKRITVICQKNCDWRIHAAKTHDEEAFQVKTFKGKDYNCGWERDNRWVTSKWLADKYVDNVRDTHDWSNTAFKNRVLRDHNVEVSRHQTYRAKRKAKKQVEGSHAEQFKRGCVIMSDMQKGLQQVLESIDCDHRVCVRHLYANFKKLYKGKSLKDGLWNVYRATTMHIFKHHMSVLKSLHVDAHNWLTKYPANTWSKHTFSPRTKCDILQNNIAETFNLFILDARDKPIITMFEMIRRLLMQRFVAKKEGMENYRGPICPRIQTKLERAKLESRNYICYAMAVYKTRRTPEEYVDSYYSTSTFLNAYSTTIGPVPGEEYWPPTNCNQILPPEYKTAPGRPKKA